MRQSNEIAPTKTTAAIIQECASNERSGCGAKSHRQAYSYKFGVECGRTAIVKEHSYSHDGDDAFQSDKRHQKHWQSKACDEP